MSSPARSSSTRRDAQAFAVAHLIVQAIKRIAFTIPPLLLFWIVIGTPFITAAALAYIAGLFLEFALKHALELG